MNNNLHLADAISGCFQYHSPIGAQALLNSRKNPKMKYIILLLLILLAICTCQRILEDTPVLGYDSEDDQIIRDGPIEIELSTERIHLTTDDPSNKEKHHK